jgi:hypothetical protein
MIVLFIRIAKRAQQYSEELIGSSWLLALKSKHRNNGSRRSFSESVFT